MINFTKALAMMALAGTTDALTYLSGEVKTLETF